jgi:hypothetical protein
VLRSIRRWRVVPLLPRHRSASIGQPDHDNPDATSGAPDAIQQIDFHRCGGGRSASLPVNKWASRLCILQRGRLLHAMRFSNLPTVHRVGVGNGRRLHSQPRLIDGSEATIKIPSKRRPVEDRPR